MNSRERVIAAIEFKSPDRIPHRHAFLPAVFEKYQEVENLYKRFPSDFAGEEGLFQDSIAYRAGEWEDE